MKTKILVLLVGRDDGDVLPYYGIEYEGKLWLVTAWLVDRYKQVATPERMIRVDEFQKADPGGPFDYVNVLLPKSAIEGRSQDTPGFEVRSLPEKPVVDVRALKPLPNLFR